MVTGIQAKIIEFSKAHSEVHNQIEFTFRGLQPSPLPESKPHLKTFGLAPGRQDLPKVF
jgi:hypothetical protein